MGAGLCVVDELPGRQLAGGTAEAIGYGFVGIRAREPGEALALERIGGGGEVEVVGESASRDVDVGLGSRRRGVDPAGGDVPGRPLDGVAGEGVGVVDPDLNPPRRRPVMFEERPGGR